MNAVNMERMGYRRLNFDALNFTSDENINKKDIDDIAPIKWSKEVLTGEKQVVIKKK